MHDRLLKASNPLWLPALVQNTGLLLEGYMALAHIDKNPWKSTRFPPQGLKFSELPNNNPSKARAFPDILRRNQAPGPHAVPAVLTHTPPLDPLRRYEGAAVVRLDNFDSTFQLATSGNSKPVILTCFGSDGRRYKQVGVTQALLGDPSVQRITSHEHTTTQQVVKPEDVRQDGVMMQVFSTVNALLARDPAARRRALAIRTYRVVPLTPDSGVLEFVCNTKVRRDGRNNADTFTLDKSPTPVPELPRPHSRSAWCSPAPAPPATRASTRATTRGT